jgi:hypothetical protein
MHGDSLLLFELRQRFAATALSVARSRGGELPSSEALEAQALATVKHVLPKTSPGDAERWARRLVESFR